MTFSVAWFGTSPLQALWFLACSTTRAATWLDLANVAVLAGAIDLGIAALATTAKHLTR